MPDAIVQTTQPSGNEATPPPPASPTPPAAPTPSVIPPKPVPPGTAIPGIPAGKQQPPSKSPADSESENALIPGSGSEGPPKDWRESLPPEYKNEKALGHINSIEDLAKSYVNAQKLLGQPKISVPDPKVATPEDYRAAFKKLGLPEDVKDYKIEAAKDSGLDPEFLKEFQENAFKVGILPQHAQEVLNWYTEASKTMLKGLTENQQRALQDEHKALHSEWGKAYPQKLLAAQLVVRDFADEGAVKYLQESGIHQNPQFLKFLSRIGETLREPELKGSNGRGTPMKTPAEAMSEANSIIADTSHPYNKPEHPNHKFAVEEVGRLFEMASPPPPEENT